MRSAIESRFNLTPAKPRSYSSFMLPPSSLQLLLRLRRRLHLGGSHVLELDRRRAVDVAILVVEVDASGDVILRLGQRAVLHPELGRPLGVADLRAICAGPAERH